MTQIKLYSALGVETLFNVPNPAAALEVQATQGKYGYTPSMLPAPSGGLRLPLDNEADFDWNLIGARRMEFAGKDGGPPEVSVYWRGNAYKRRVLEAVESKKLTMSAAVKYSRGARATDPEAIREKAEGDIEYVTLLTFKGGGRVDAWSVGARGADPVSTRPTTSQGATTDPSSKGGKLTRLQELIKAKGFTATQVRESVGVKQFSELSDTALDELLEKIAS